MKDPGAVSGDRRTPEWALPNQQLPGSWQMEAAIRRMEMFSVEPSRKPA